MFLLLSFFLRLCSEVPLLEDTLMRILVIGLSRDLPLGPADAMELADHLVKRAAGVHSDGGGSCAFYKSLKFTTMLEKNKGTISPLNDQSSITLTEFKHFFTDLEVLKVERMQLIDAVLNLCTYHHPENIQLPAG